MKKIFLVLLVFLSVACAKVHTGKYAMINDGSGNLTSMKNSPTDGIIISAETDKAYSNEYSKFMVFTLENKSGQVKEVTGVTPIFEKSYGSSIRVLSGEDLKVWFEQQEAEKQRKEKNKSTFLGLTTVAGGLLAAFTDDTWEAIGVGLLAGGAASLTLDELYKDKNNIERGRVFPGSHLMSDGYRISPGLYERKWIVFGVDNAENYPKELELEYRVDNGALETVVIPLKW